MVKDDGDYGESQVKSAIEEHDEETVRIKELENLLEGQICST